MRYCLADFFLLQKKKEITAGLIRENKIAGIACRVAASSNNGINLTGISLRSIPAGYPCVMPLKVIMEFLEELKKLRKERADKAPFESLLEFEEWADSVQPLLSFHEGYDREFKQAVTSATVTARIGSLKDANNNMNSAVGILNKVIKTAEIQSSQKNVKSLEMYVSLNRINEIENLDAELDFSKLCMLLRELNTAYENELYYSTGCLIRAILDHVPAVFGCKNFNEVANNYQGSKSFKEAMRGLNEQMRKVTDSYLHTQIRNKEVLPVQQQVEARSSLDLLLSEIIRIA